MLKPESAIENEIHEILWDFVIQTNHQVLARRSDFLLINKENLSSSYFAIPTDHSVKIKESKKKTTA